MPPEEPRLKLAGAKRRGEGQPKAPQAAKSRLSTVVLSRVPVGGKLIKNVEEEFLIGLHGCISGQY